MSAREEILQRLRAAHATVRLPPSPAIAPLVQGSASPDETLARFELEAAALGVSCYVEQTPDEVRRRVATLVHGVRILSWDADQLPYETSTVLSGVVLGNAPRHEQAAAHVGVTGCDAAIAETASLVLISGPGRSRAVSLLPLTHIAIVERHQLCFSMADAFTTHRHRFGDSASWTVITGPSRTADIELTLTLGIHGPGRLVVVIGP